MLTVRCSPDRGDGGGVASGLKGGLGVDFDCNSSELGGSSLERTLEQMCFRLGDLRI